MEHFTYAFIESSRPNPELLAQADLILADLQDVDVQETMHMLSTGKKAEAELILLVGQTQIQTAAEIDEGITDVWGMPMSGAEIRFRFGRWQKTFKLRKDEKVNSSFSATVGVGINMTRQQAFEQEIEDQAHEIEKQAQEIQDKDRVLEMLFSTMDCGIMCHSMDGTEIISVNEAGLRILDYESLEEMQSSFKMVADSVVDEDKPKLRSCITGLKKAGDSASVEYRVQHKDGKVLHVLGNVKLVENGGELFYQRFLVDVTDRKLREERKLAEKENALLDQEQRLEIFSTFLSDHVDDIYMMMNESGTVVEFVTPNIERVLGISREAVLKDVKGSGLAEYVTGRRVSYEDLRKLKSGMMRETMETKRINKKTGEEKWFFESLYAVSVQGVKKIVVYISDRTRERKNQEELSRALEMAQMASEAKSSFLSSVSHDIRTPLNAIMGFLTLLKAEADNPEAVSEYTQKISVASGHLVRLIDDVLDMSRIESGKTELHISELDLSELVEEIYAIIRPQAKAKEQDFEIYATSLTNEHLLGDRLRINQILINLLSNAVKYTGNGGEIKMRLEERPCKDEDYSRIRFTISDNGQGMSEEYQKVIFDPFTRESSAIRNKIQGTGLGMAITKSLVDLMNGSIKVTSKLGEGSSFEVELELRIQDREDEPKFWEERNVRRILIVNDSPDIRRDISRKMDQTGVEIQYAVDGMQSVRVLKSAEEAGRAYDLILLDDKPADMDWLATARLLQDNFTADIPVLLFTASDWMDIKDDALAAGIRSFLPKPFFMNSFKRAVQRILSPVKKKENTAAAEESVVKGSHVLVVDDIMVNRTILVKIMSILGAKCDMAENGQEAVEKFEASRPGEYDMILMDVQMPVLDGYEATRAIRAGNHPEAKTVPIIAMTANAFTDDIQAALDAGMNAHVAKPIVLGQLKEALQKVLKNRNGEKTDRNSFMI